eukprot:GHVU01043509.1.p1 GENE.GHVU01043509.1~~GHVU01043509.1.p1  ORF type:complete len:170 (-),score=4.08 GHVU01043509.1:211-720(-)
MVCSWHALARTLVAVCFRAPCPCTPCSKDIESMLRASRELETTWRHDELSSATQKQYEIVRNNFFKHSLIIRLDPTPNDSSRKAKARQVPAAWNRVHPQPPPVPAQQSLPVPRPAAHHDLHLKVRQQEHRCRENTTLVSTPCCIELPSLNPNRWSCISWASERTTHFEG